MLLRMSTLFLRTLREDPADADAPGYRLLLRAGYLRRANPASHTWLPLGKLLLDQVTRIVREEMATIGGQEVSLPVPLPGEPNTPAQEEIAALLVKDVIASYRDLPVLLHQVQTKVRDEPRPRAGLLRSRDHLVADAWSVDLDEAGLADAYAKQRAAYLRILERLGLSQGIVAAVAGTPGDRTAEAFLVASPVGEDLFATCANCGYAAVVEAVTTPAPPAGDPDAHPPAQVHDTPDTPTIASLVDLANARRLAGRSDWSAADTLKNVVVAVRRPGAERAEPLVIGVPGDREVDLARVAAALHPATVTMFEDFADHPDLVRGYIGPQILAKLGIRYLVDPRVVPGTAWLTGANQPGRHATNVVCGRDFVPDGTIEAVQVRSGDPCPVCASAGKKGVLTIDPGVEIGRIAQLGRRYTDAFGVDIPGPEGKPVRPTMGYYGLDVFRLVAAIAEQHHDAVGLAWPEAVAPCDVHVIAAGKGAQLDAALELGAELADTGLRVLVDDRTTVSAGVKFTDAELIGLPRAVVVGRRLADGYVELRERTTGERLEVPRTELLSRLAR